MDSQRKNLRQLFLPIYLELLGQFLTGSVDTVMISSVGDQAVGALGTANTYISIFIIMFSVISTGMLAVMTQYIGAGRTGVAFQARKIGLVFNLVLGVLLSAFLLAFSGWFLDVMGVAAGLRGYAVTYFKIVGGTSFITALIPIFSGGLRAFGMTRPTLAGSITMNLSNLALNALFLFVFHWGVAGVAAATALSKVFNLAILIIASKKLRSRRTDGNRAPVSQVLRQILKVGVPSAMETMIYNIAMTLMISILNRMDSDGFNATARSYAMQLSNLSYCAAMALSQANAIITGWLIGAGEYDKCDRSTMRSAAIGTVVSILFAAVIALASGPLMGLFTDDPEMISTVSRLLILDIVLEVGRTGNLVFGNALKASGDALFTTILGAVFMLLCAAGGSWLFGMRMGLLVFGAYLGMTADECCRAVGMLIRWRQGAWRSKSMVSDSERVKNGSTATL